MTTRDELLAAADELEQTGCIMDTLPASVAAVIGPLTGRVTTQAAATALRQAAAQGDRHDNSSPPPAGSSATVPPHSN